MKKLAFPLLALLVFATTNTHSQDLSYQNIYKTVYQKATKSVVGIQAVQVGNPLRGETYRPIVGSGVILDNQGTIVTNKHVVERTRNLKVILYNNEEFSARFVSTTPDIDLAIIKMENVPPDLQSVTLGDSDKLEPGEIVLAIGNPAGLSKTLTHGIVSAVGRYVSEQDRPAPHTFVQTDAAINPGNSGGALINLSGELVGIPTLTLFRVQNISFAIPVNVLKTVLPQLLSSPDKIGWLGIATQKLTPDLRSAIDIPKNVNGLVVSSLHPSSPAKNKLEPLDIIVKAGDTATTQKSDLEWAVRNTAPGTEITLSVFKSKLKALSNVVLKVTTEPAQKQSP